MDRDDSLENSASLAEPDELIAEAIEELTCAITDLQSILVDLGASEEIQEGA